MAEQLKLPEVARRLGVSEKTARRYVKSGALPSMFVGGAYRVSEEDLEGFLQGAKVTPSGGSPKAPASSQHSFNGLLAEERLLTYLRASLDEIRGKAAWARSILEKTSSFAEPLVDEPGVTREATLNMWSTHITALQNDAHVLAVRWRKIFEGISVESLPSQERLVVEALLSELQNFESAVEALQAKFYSDFQQHRDAVKLLPNLHERRPSDAPAADKRESAGA